MRKKSKKHIILMLVAFLLIFNVNKVMANDKYFEKNEDGLNWTIIGYDLIKEKEIFGELSKDEIHEVLYSLIHKDKSDKLHKLKNEDIDYSQIFIISNNSISKSLSDDNLLSSMITKDNSYYPLSKTFRYMVEFDLGTGSHPINYYLTTVTRFPIRPPYRFGIDSMYTRHDPNWPYNVNFNVKEVINGEFGYVTISWIDINSINVANATFEVLRNGNIIMR